MAISPPTGFANVQLTLHEFASESLDGIVGMLATGLAARGFDAVTSAQLNSWRGQIAALQTAAAHLQAKSPRTATDLLLLEYTIPVIRRRIDALLLHDDKIVIVEYKHGNGATASAALRQAQDYALDLSDYHEYSRKVQIFPIALGPFPPWLRQAPGPRGLAISEADLSSVLDSILQLPQRNDPIDQTTWSGGRYYPVPPVIEAAVAAFNGHRVKEIAMSRADTEALERSKGVLVDAVAHAKKTGSKIICVLTGVPGAGKTLAGLNAVSEVTLELKLESEQAVYLSGNVPLVNVLREALYRDRKGRAETVTKARLEVLIQEMHRFVADNYDTSGPPAARMIVFDEAQRAWSRARNLRKFGRDVSEPEMVFQKMERHTGWSVIVALVGGGQEIHSGEAGLEEWGRAAAAHPQWRVWASPVAVEGGPAVAGSRLFTVGCPPHRRPVVRAGPHLEVCLRSLDAEHSADWVNAALEGRPDDAAAIAARGLPIFRCRSLTDTKSWLWSSKLGSRRAGLVASSAAERLRAIGIETPTYAFMMGIDYVKWFLEPDGDVRSSNQLEVALSEFEVQGLELDFVGLVWGGDLIFDTSGPLVRKFSGTRWLPVPRTVNKPLDNSNVHRAFQEGLNRYRVLMTRYRKAMTIFVPSGSADDPTRLPGEMDSVYDYLGRCGLAELGTELADCPVANEGQLPSARAERSQ